MPAIEKPLMLYDGECRFCRAWIRRWQKLTGERIAYQAYQSFETVTGPEGQDVLREFPQVSVKACREAIQLIVPDGRVFRAAEAVFRALAENGRGRAWLWLYRRVPGFGPISEWLYRWVAHHRGRLRNRQNGDFLA